MFLLLWAYIMDVSAVVKQLTTISQKKQRTTFVKTVINNCERFTFFNPLTAGAAFIRVFIFLSHLVPPFKNVKDKM